MEIENQVKAFISGSKNVLIAPSYPLQEDCFAAALSLFYTLKKLNKNVNLLAQDVPQRLRFLATPVNKNFVIAINNKDNDLEEKISEIRYEKNKDQLNLYLTLKNGGLSEKDISFALEEENMAVFNQKPFLEPPDTVITLGVQSLKEAEKLTENELENLYDVNVLNIDRHSFNENFGHINFIETETSSLSALIFKLIKSINQELLDKKTATCLLGGIVSASQNSQNIENIPEILKIIGYLTKKGGNYQKIVQALYQKNSLSQVNLLSKILGKLEIKKGIYLATLKEEDFYETRASSKDLGFVIKELKSNFLRLPSFLLLWESRCSPIIIKGIFYSSKQNLVENVINEFEGTRKGKGILFLIRENSLKTAQDKISKTLNI